MMAIQAQVPSVARVSPNVDARAQVVHGNRNWGTRIRGVTPDYLPIRRMRVEQGSVFSEEDVRRAAKVCLLGRTVTAQLFDDADPTGQVILIRNLPCKVLGILETKGVSANGQDQDDIILMPFTLVQKQIMGITWLDDIMVSAVSPEAIPAAEDDIAAVMRERHHIRDPREDDFNLRHPASVLEVGAEARKTLTLLLASIAAVALVVGGIGIMNIMLASVTERTREIGIRRAVGARRGNIVAQFLTEAVTLSLLGGGAGIALGILGAWSVGALTGWRILIEPAAVALAVGFAGAVGIFFGAYPAIVAARLDPVEALGR
jgi:putative ABC transport system permease protein